MRKFFASFRRTAPVTAAEIQRQLAALRQQHTQSVRQRHALALDAMRDQAAAQQWAALDEAAQHLTRRIDVLVAALPQAEAKEADARERAEAAARAKRMQEYERQTAEAQAWLDAVLARLPDGETLTAARDWRDRLHDEARSLRAWSNDVRVRRPVDPLAAIYDALGHRIQRLERARWARSAPITLLDDTKAAS